jgi:endonuclease/exonuclease/phosphatase family metal-dependent hydrolase
VSTTVLRVATWNVHGLRAGVEAVAGVVHDQSVDILLIQESGPRRRLRGLGAALGMIVCADPPAFPSRRIQNAVLVRSPGAVRSHRLVRFAGGSVLQPRGALVARLDDLTAVSVHLGTAGAERGRHVDQLLELLGRIDGPFVIGGDLNAHPEDAVAASIAANSPDVWTSAVAGAAHEHGATFPSYEPSARIDYLFAGSAIQALRAWTAGGTVSDHQMVVADLQIGG